MAELVVNIPDDVVREIEKLPGVNWSDVAVDAIRSKAFELSLERSMRLELLLLKTITSKSELSEEEADRFAIELGNKIKVERLEELKSRGLI